MNRALQRFISDFFSSKLNGYRKIALITTIVIVIPFITWGIVSVRESPKTQQAKDFLENSEEFKQIVGEIEGYGFLVEHQIMFNQKVSYIGLKVKGSVKNVNALVFFNKDQTGHWIIDKYEIK